ncbi:chlorinating enzyme [Frankia sp. Cj5]|uniref:chlorinating enzyme n=1 Tax=Frankia sp. Cj5 TaxID=2880978 RepID=UPI001EF484E7|nr:chlorinating enzyme [Frankia sp. Cj5]
MAVTHRADEDLRAFAQNGFIGPFDLYTPEQAAQILRRVRVANRDRSRILFDNSVNYDRHFDIPELAEHIGHPTIVSKVAKILGPDLLHWRTEFFPKFPGTPGTEWHQVRNYQYATGQPMLEHSVPGLDDLPLDITVWTTFTPATKENGCMKFLPGSHRRRYYDESKSGTIGRTGEYRSVEAMENDGSFFGYDFREFRVDPDWTPPERDAVALEMDAGQCVIFTAQCVHASYPNTTRRSTRFAIATRYVPTEVRVYPGWTTFEAHGGSFDLADYGCVLVSGEDAYGHNRIRTHDNHGRPFPRHALTGSDERR